MKTHLRIPTCVKAGYGAAECANSAIFTLFYTFGMFFFTDVVKIEPAFAGTMLAVGTLWNAFMDPAVGVWSDNSRSRWGRRRPFLLGIAVPFGIIAWLLFSDFQLGAPYTEIYFFSVVLLYFTAYSLLEVPHLSLSAEMTQDYDERTSLVSWRIGWSQVGSVIGGALPLMLVAYFAASFGSQARGWSLMAGCCGLACIPLILFTWRATRGYELFPEETKIRFKDIFREPLRNRPYRFVVLGYTFGLVAVTIGAGAGVYFMTYVIGMTEAQISMAIFVAVGVAMLWIPAINFVTTKLGKRWAWSIFVGIGLVNSGILIQFVIQPGQVIFYYFLAFLIGAVMTSVYMLAWAMIPDCVEVDEFKTGQRREGLYFGFISFAQKAACALAMQILGLTLSWIGYVPDAPQSEEVLLGIRSIVGLGVVVFIVVSIISIALMPMTREKHEALCEAIRLKKQGREYDVTPFADLVR